MHLMNFDCDRSIKVQERSRYPFATAVIILLKVVEGLIAADVNIGLG